MPLQGVWPGRDVADNFFLAHVDYKAWCKTKGHVVCPRFEYSKLCPRQDFPTFTQQTAKASMTKHLIEWLHSVLCRPGVVNCPVGEMVFLLFDQWVLFESICNRNDRFLAAGDIGPLADAAENALVAQLHLHTLAIQDYKLDWHILPKSHMSTHLAFDQASQGVNPRRVTNYADEDMVGKVKKIMSSCHGGSAGKMCMYRYIILVGTRWWTRLSHLRGLR